MPSQSHEDEHPLIRELYAASDNSTRRHAAERLTRLGRGAIPLVIPLLADPNWRLRFWSVRILGDIGDRSAYASLLSLRQHEQEGAIFSSLDEAIRKLRSRYGSALPPSAQEKSAPLQPSSAGPTAYSPDAGSFEPSSTDLAFLDSWLDNDPDPEPELVRAHRRASALQYHLKQALRDGDDARAELLRVQLIDAQIHIRRCLAGTLTQAEEDELRAKYAEGATSERLLGLLGRVTWCWVCWADIYSTSNERCRCGWLICDCGACQCPDFSLGPRDHQPECEAQIERLGPDHYAKLVEARQTRSANYSFARVDFGNI